MRELVKPSYVPIKYISSLPLNHVWDDWDPYPKIGWPSETLKSALSLISNRAITAFSLGCAEWVVHRFFNFSEDELPYHYIAAYWLYVMGDESAIPRETEHEEWLGAIRGPINLALMTTLNTIYLSDDGPPIQNGAFSAKIVEHVLPEKQPFETWMNAILPRLHMLFPRNLADQEGPPVAREALDPNFLLSTDEMIKLISDFSTALRSVHNDAID